MSDKYYVCHFRRLPWKSCCHAIFHPQCAGLYATCSRKSKPLSLLVMPHLQAAGVNIWQRRLFFFYQLFKLFLFLSWLYILKKLFSGCDICTHKTGNWRFSPNTLAESLSCQINQIVILHKSLLKGKLGRVSEGMVGPGKKERGLIRFDPARIFLQTLIIL